IKNGSTTGFIATGCSSLPRLKCRAKSSRLTPALSLPTRSAPRSSPKRPSTASMRRPAKICCLLLRAPPRCACRPWPTRKGHLPRKVNQRRANQRMLISDDDVPVVDQSLEQPGHIVLDHVLGRTIPAPNRHFWIEPSRPPDPAHQVIR